MCTQSIFRSFFRDSTSIEKQIIILLTRISIHLKFFWILMSSSCFFFGFFLVFWGEKKKYVKMRLTFMVVFFTIYNAQSQRKRKFSCINQKKAPWKKKLRAREREREVIWVGGFLVRCVYENFHRLKWNMFSRACRFWQAFWIWTLKIDLEKAWKNWSLRIKSFLRRSFDSFIHE